MPKPDVTVERTQQIIAAAISVFARLGTANTRMTDIAQEAGVSKGTLYLYFESKEALVGAILDSSITRELAFADQLLTTEMSTIEKLGAISEILIADLKQLQPLMPLYMEFIAQAARGGSVRMVLQKPFHKFLTFLVSLIEEGITGGEFRNVDAKEAALTLSALFEGTILLWVYDPQLLDLEQQIKAGLDLMLAGLAA